MRIPLLLGWLTVVYCQKNATDTASKATPVNDIVVNIIKMSRDSPRPFVAYNQGSLTPQFPAIARIRSKTKPTFSDRVTPGVGSESESGRNEDLHKLINSLEHSQGSKGAFSRKATRIGSTYSSYPFQVEYTGEPYLNGYRGVPETQGTTSSEPNYMGALTRSNKAGKHTFGSYGSIDSEKAQMWQSRATGSNVDGYGRPGVYASNMDYTGGFSKPSTGYTSPDPVYSSYSNPYSASYQGGSDNSYGSNRYSSDDYLNYGTQVADGMNTQWSGQGYQKQGYSSLPTQGYDNSGWQSPFQQSSWPQENYPTADNSYSQNSGYGNMEVEKMPSTGYTGYQYPSSTYSSPSVESVFTGNSYGVNNGADYGGTSQQSYNYGNYAGTGSQTSYAGSSNQVPSYTGSTYGIPTGTGSTYSGDNGYFQQENYGNNNAWNQYGSPDSRYQSTYAPSWQYGSSDVQNGGHDYYKPSQEYGYAQNYGNTGYQTDSYSPMQTSSGYGGAYGTNYGYQDGGNQGNYATYGGGPQVEFTMNVGYGSSRASKGVKAKPSLTNNIAPNSLDEDGYRTKIK